MCAYVTDVLLCPPQTLQLWSVRHHAEATPLTLLKVLLVLDLETKTHRDTISLQLECLD